MENSRPRIYATSAVHIKKLLNVYNRPMGNYLPNLVTLPTIATF
jgi:hypothetical protein